MINFSLLDIFSLILLLFGGLMGVYRGFISSILGLCGWITSIYFSIKLFPIAEPFLVDKFSSPFVAFICGFIGVFILLLFATGLLKLVLTDLLQKIIPVAADRALGLFFGMAKVCIVVFAFLYGIAIILSHFNGVKMESPENWPTSIASSCTMQIFFRYCDVITRFLPHETQEKLAKLDQKENRDDEHDDRHLSNMLEHFIDKRLNNDDKKKREHNPQKEDSDLTQLS